MRATKSRDFPRAPQGAENPGFSIFRGTRSYLPPVRCSCYRVNVLPLSMMIHLSSRFEPGEAPFGNMADVG